MANISLLTKNFESVYESLQKIISRECRDLNDTVVIESPFNETTRDGFILRYVRLALTSKAFVIATDKSELSALQGESILGDCCSTTLISFFPWKLVKIFVFKNSKRKCIKASFLDKSTRYFEMQDKPKTKIFWDLWCRYVKELNNTPKRWPFVVLSKYTDKNISSKFFGNNCTKIYIIKHNKQKMPWLKWTDKHLYLGSTREAEDQIRPRPVPGLGKTEKIKLLYLKPRYFGCWEQSEHWVQCGNSSTEFAIINKPNRT